MLGIELGSVTYKASVLPTVLCPQPILYELYCTASQSFSELTCIYGFRKGSTFMIFAIGTPVDPASFVQEIGSIWALFVEYEKRASWADRPNPSLPQWSLMYQWITDWGIQAEKWIPALFWFLFLLFQAFPAFHCLVVGEQKPGN